MSAGRPRQAWSNGRKKTGTARALPLHHAVALGLLHGPTELLPVSSSGHTTLVPWLAGWPYSELDPQLRKSFEVALHAGTAAALLLYPPAGARPGTQRSGGSAFLAAAVLPPALAGYLLGEQIEQRLGTPRTIAAGLLAGSGAMLAAEIRSRRRNSRLASSARWRDGLALGVAQALALMPGVSRSGASLVAARARGFSTPEADRLSWASGLPVIAGAALLQGTQLAHTGVAPQTRAALAAGAGASLLSTWLSARLLGDERRAALLPVCIAYRGTLALLAIRRVRDNTR